MIPTIVTYATLGHAGAGTTAIETPTWVIALGIGAAILLGITATRIVKQALQGAEASAQSA
jgi:hypothetical protein